MSHFSVLVVTENPDQVADALQPFHEFECTGEDDQYVVEIDMTKQVLEEFDTETVDCLRDSLGNLHSFYDDCGSFKEEFSRSGEGGWQERFVPEGYKQVEAPVSMFESADEWAKDNYGWHIIKEGEPIDVSADAKWGYILLDEHGCIRKCIDRTNPNKKWDWWEVGGRWSGFLKPKDASIGIKGEAGVGGTQFDSTGVDQCIKSNVDFDYRREEAGKEAAARYDLAMNIIDGREWLCWEDCRDNRPDGSSIDEARSAYHSQTVIADLKREFDNPFFGFSCFKDSREAYIKKVKDAAISTFAVLMDGKWYQRGGMGWWGCVSDENDSWDTDFKGLLDKIPDDACLTVVDCHI